MNAKAAPITEADVIDEVQNELVRFKKEWWCFLLLGFTLIICGAIAIVFPFFSSTVVVIVIGAALIVGGVSLIISSFWAGRWSGFFLQLLVGVFYTVAGFTVIDAPLRSVVVFTLLLAAFFIVIGIIRIVTALVDRYPMWGWSLLNGAITLLLGVIIYRNCKPSRIAEAMTEGDIAALADSWLWVIGLLVGIDLIFNGWNWVMLGMSINRLPDIEEEE